MAPTSSNDHEVYFPTGMGDPWATRKLGQHALDTLKAAANAHRAASLLYPGSKPHLDHAIAAAALVGRATGLISAYQLSDLKMDSAARLCTRVQNLVLAAADLRPLEGTQLLESRFPELPTKEAT